MSVRAHVCGYECECMCVVHVCGACVWFMCVRAHVCGYECEMSVPWGSACPLLVADVHMRTRVVVVV